MSTLRRLAKMVPRQARNTLRRLLVPDTRISPADLARDVLVVGYYGAGNFGDDVLGRYVVELVSKSVSCDRILIDASEDSYMQQWFPGTRCMPLGTFGRHASVGRRRVIFGGGGLFHAFAAPSDANLWGLEGSTIHAYRERLGEQNWTKAGKYAFCVGVGPLVGDGAKWIAGGLLNGFEHISVRDETSQRLLSSLGVSGAILAADPSLALTRSLPMPVHASSRPQTLGIVIRNWTHSPRLNRFLDDLHAAARALRSTGWHVEFISFQSSRFNGTELAAEERLSRQGEVVRAWDPGKDSVASFTEYLRTFSVMLTMRAHGVFLAAMLGATPIAVLIEPKLEITAATCGFSDLSISLDDDPDRIVAAVHRAHATTRRPDWSDAIGRLDDASRHLAAWLDRTADSSADCSTSL